MTKSKNGEGRTFIGRIIYDKDSALTWENRKKTIIGGKIQYLLDDRLSLYQDEADYITKLYGKFL